MNNLPYIVSLPAIVPVVRAVGGLCRDPATVSLI
jgi:hypothetical protein